MTDNPLMPVTGNINVDAPLGKLVRELNRFFGTDARNRRRMAEAESYARKLEVETDIDIKKLELRGMTEIFKGVEAFEEQTGIELSPDQLQVLLERTALRVNRKEMRRQLNIESVVQKAKTQLPESVSEEEVDEDWMRKFFNYAQDVSDEDVQKIWAIILAGEVAQPGTFSPRTLNFVSMLSTEEARLFTKVCPYIVEIEDPIGNNPIGLIIARGKFPIPEDHSDFARLQAAGFISRHVASDYGIRYGETIALKRAGERYKASVDVDKRGLGFHRVYYVTDSARELASLCNEEGNDFWEDLLDYCRNKDGVTVEKLD